MGKKRVYEFAKENDVASKKVLDTAKGLGIDYNSHMSSMDDGDVEKLKKAINNLSEGQRIAFLMNRVEGKKYREIAEILEISVKAVEKRMSLALIALRKEIDEI